MMAQALEALHARTMKLEQDEAQRAQWQPANQDQVARFFTARVKAEKKEPQNVAPQTTQPPVKREQPEGSNLSGLSVEQLGALLRQVQAGGTGSASAAAAAPGYPPMQAENDATGVTIPMEEYRRLLQQAAKSTVTRTYGPKANFPAEAPRSGNLWYMIMDEASSSGKAVFVHGWMAAEQYFRKGVTWDWGKPENGRFIRGYATSDLAYSAWVKEYSLNKKGDGRWMVPMYR